MKTIKPVILAAGEGKHMNSAHQTALFTICGRAMIDYVAAAAAECTSEPPIVVTGFCGDDVRGHLGEGYTYTAQKEQLGSANAFAAAKAELAGLDGAALVLLANAPLVSAGSMQELVEAAGDGAIAALYPDDESDSGCVAICVPQERIAGLPENGDQDHVIETLIAKGENVKKVYAPASECIVAADRASLWECTRLRQAMITAAHLRNGVTMIEPASITIDADVTIGRDAVLHRGVELTGNTAIGEGTELFSGTRLNDTEVGSGCTFKNVVSNGAVIGNNVTIGPFVNIRPGTRIADGCKIGDFMEIKNSTVGEGTKLPHLSYIGDADVGSHVNVGCGCVFVNYDGFEKHRTTVGNDVFLGCQTNLVAPVTVGDNAYTAAGTTVTEDVPAGALAIARPEQTNKPGWAEKFRALKKGK